MCLQLDRLAQQDLMGQQDHPADQEASVLLDPQDQEVFKAIQVLLDHSDSLDSQVCSHRYVYWITNCVCLMIFFSQKCLLL